MGRQSQRKGAEGEQELAQHLRRAGYHVQWDGNKTYETVPDLSGLVGIHIECKRVEQFNLARAMDRLGRMLPDSGMVPPPCSTGATTLRGSLPCASLTG